MYKINLLITGGYRTFEESIKDSEYYNFFNFDQYDYHIFFILTDDEDIELINNKKNFIKNFFGSKLKLCCSLFENESDKKKFYDEFHEIEIKNNKLKKEVIDHYKKEEVNNHYKNYHKIYEGINNVCQNYYYQYFKIYLAHKLRDDYSQEKYDLYIRIRPDLTLRKYTDPRPNQFKNLSEIIELINDKKLFNKEFAIVSGGIVGIYSKLGAELEKNMINNLFYGYIKNYPISDTSLNAEYTEELNTIHYFTFLQEWNLWNILKDNLNDNFIKINGDYDTFVKKFSPLLK